MDWTNIYWPAALLMLLAFLCAVEFVLNLHLTRADRRTERSHRRLRRLAADLQHPENRSPEATIVRERLGSGAVPAWRAWAEGRGPFRALRVLLYRAGWAIGAWRFVLLSAGLSVAVLGIGSGMGSPTVATAAAAIAGLLPLAWAARRKRTRTRLFERQLPEALDLICRALRAGHALSMGIQMVADELDAPIAVEFGQMADEIGLGMDSREALANLCSRIDVSDLGFFSTAVLIQRETGGNLAEVMGRLSSVIRKRHEFEGKVSALTAQNRGAALVLLCTPPGFLLLMHRASPEFVAPLFQPGPGEMLAWAATALTLVGYALARRLAVVRA